jgi:hypothetical protein
VGSIDGEKVEEDTEEEEKAGEGVVTDGDGAIGCDVVRAVGVGSEVLRGDSSEWGLGADVLPARSA